MIPGVFATVARGLRLPTGWGFPATVINHPQLPSRKPEAVALRRILFPSDEEEMLCQLVRWHYALLRSRPHIWRSLSGPYESYEPCGVFKHSIEGDFFKVCPDPFTGFLSVGWEHHSETEGLIGTLRRTGEGKATLSFPGWEGTVGMYVDDNPTVWRVLWPAWMNTQAAFVIPEETATEGLVLSFRVRPITFDASGMVLKVTERASHALQAVGLLDSFISAVNPLDKIAVVWLALAMLEEAWDLQRREGDSA